MPTELQLSEVLSEFARTMVTDFRIQAILDRFVLRVVDILPITAAGVTLIAPGLDPQYVAASDESAYRFEALQTEIGEGPCLAAYRTGEAISAPDLHYEQRFLKFGPRALAEGLVAVFAFPLRHGDERLGALDLYRDSPGPLDASTMEAAQTLADVAAAYLINAQGRADLAEAGERSLERAMHDGLTGLPNRNLFLERLEHALARGRRTAKVAAVLFCDLDTFKQVNDRHGHSVGDELLVAVARRLTAMLRPGDTLARLSGDEFVILCEDLAAEGEVDSIASRVLDQVSEPFMLSCGVVDVTASVGIAFAGRGDQLPADLLHDADTAMYQAKRKGGGRHQVIDLREQHRASHRMILTQDLKGAAVRGELRTEYQPIVETTSGVVVGVEALLRWDHPRRGIVMPTLVIPLAEQAGLITEIGRWVLEQACPDRRRWQNQPLRHDLGMAVNVSAHQLMSPEFVSTIDSVLTSTNTDPSLVTLEVTESVFIQDSERALVVLKGLKGLGVKLALDDFGTGYSSLTYLKRFPIDTVKVDRVFVADLEDDKPSHAIVYAVIELAHLLGITVVAEGVETRQQRKELDAMGCDYCQGYYFARPMSAHAFDIFIQDPPNGDIRLPVSVV